METWHKRYVLGQYNFFVRELATTTRGISQYLDILDIALKSHEEEFRRLYDYEKEGLSEDEREKISGIYFDRIFDVIKFPTYLYSSYVMSWYSTVEKSLLNLCQELDLKIGVSALENESLGTGITRGYKFLSQAAGFTIKNSYWQELQLIGRVRNKLVHSNESMLAYPNKGRMGAQVKIHVENGSVDKDFYLPLDNELYKHISDKGILEYTGGSTDPENEFSVFVFSPTYEYCKYLTAFQRKFFMDIYDGLLETAKSNEVS